MDRDLIVICYCRPENRKPAFDRQLMRQLQGLLNAQQGRLQFRVERFDEGRLGTPDGVDQFRDILSRARVVVLLEGPEFMASNFVQDEQTLNCIEMLLRHSAVRVFRLPIWPVSPFSVPESFAELQAAWGGEALSGLPGHQRGLAWAKIVEALAEALLDAEHPTPSDDRDELQVPPFFIDRANLIRPIAVFPARIREWVDQSGFDNLHANFRKWLDQFPGESQLHPAWRLELPRSTPDYLSHVMNCARLEQCAARLYPRCRDAQLALHACLTDYHLGLMASSLAPSHSRSQIPVLPGESSATRLAPLQNSIHRLQIQDENKRHAREIMRALLRKHGAMWTAMDELWTPIQPQAEAARDGLMAYFTAWQCIPLCELGILQRLDHACSHRNANHSLRQCYQLLDRVCHWLHMTNRLMNLVENVDVHPLMVRT